MNGQALIADRGNRMELAIAAQAGGVDWVAVSRMATLRLASGGSSAWVQMRGSANAVSREGRFVLRAGDWIAFDRESAPEIQADRHGTTLGIVVAPVTRCPELPPGRGRLSHADLRIALRLWRAGRDFATGHEDVPGQAARWMEALSAACHGGGQGRELGRCPGRSARRKQQVYARLQRARLYLEGNRHRVVRLGELAELTSFSSWYLSKTFHEIYDESPQAASVRLRLEHACELLSETDLAIGEIGAACGFENNCSFARAFRKRYGMSASGYRRYRTLAPKPARAGAALRVAASPQRQRHRRRNVAVALTRR